MDNKYNEIMELAKFHGVDVPIIYGDGTESVDRMVSITELGYILSMVFGEVINPWQQTNNSVI